MKKLIIFLIPSLMFLKIKFIGELYVPEIASIIILLLYLKKNYFNLKKYLGTFYSLCFIFLFSQIFTDIYRNSLPVDYLRGWSNIFFFIIHVSALFILLDNNKQNLFLFGIGMSFGWILTFFISPNIYALGGQYWKFGYGYAITFIFAILTTQKLFSGEILKSFIFFILSVVNFYMGYRSAAGACLLVFFLIFLSNLNVFQQFISSDKSYLKKFIVTISILFISLYFINLIYTYLAYNQYLGSYEYERLIQQSGSLGVIVGGRQELLTSIYAIFKSPLIGYGSWAYNPFSENIISDLLLKFGYFNTPPMLGYANDRIPVHSHILGSWITAGFFGIFIWLWLLKEIIKALIINLQTKNDWSYYFIFVCIIFAWEIFFSTFKGEGRFNSAYYVCVIIYINNFIKLNDK